MSMHPQEEITVLRSEVAELKAHHNECFNVWTETEAALRAEVERLRAEAKANLDLAERHMDEKHKLRAALTWIDQQRYTDRGTINPDNAFEKAGELNKRIIEIMDRAAAVLKEQT